MNNPTMAAARLKLTEMLLALSDEALDAVLEQCRGFLDMGDGNYLYSSFADRIMELEDLTDQEKGEYVQDNALAAPGRRPGKKGTDARLPRAKTITARICGLFVCPRP